MGDFKCNSGKVSGNKDNNSENYNETNDYNSRDYNSSQDYSNNDLRSDGASAAAAAGAYAAGQSDELRSKSTSNNYDPQDDIDTDGCGCGGSVNSNYDSGFSDDMQYPDDAQTATIYSETIIFTDPYSGVNDDVNTSDLIEDEQEGSEFIASDSTRPQC